MQALHTTITYGPVRSRRLGASLGINVLPPGRKICNFNCCYCQYGWTPQPMDRPRLRALSWPSARTIAVAVAGRLQLARARREPIDRLTLAGDGEPTLHPQFEAVVALLRDVRDTRLPGVPLAVLSNASTLDDPHVRRAMLALDERYLKLDAGDPTGLRRINGSTPNLAALIDNLMSVPHVVLQSMFVRDRFARIDNTTPEAIASWLAAVDRIQPRAVHVYTIDRPSAWPFLQAIPPGELTAIAARVRERGIAASAVVASRFHAD